MKLQKICIIGDGLAGLTTALVLSGLKVQIDIYSKNIGKKIKNDNRTTSISKTNYDYLSNFLKKEKVTNFWPSKEIALFYENNNKYIKFLNFKESKTPLMYTFENFKLKKILIKKIIKIKNIKIINKSIETINYKNTSIKLNKNSLIYDLIILCVGNNSLIYNKLNLQRSISNNNKEVALTTSIKHISKSLITQQFFLKEGPFAILPFKKNQASIVWSVSQNFLDINKDNLRKIIITKVIDLFGPKFKFKIDEIKSFEIKTNLKTNYSRKNILILGDGLHTIHPLAGQGFNLNLRDLQKLENLIYKSLNLGLLINQYFVLKKFDESRKPENILLGLGFDFTSTFFKDSKIFNPLKKVLLKNVNNNIVKKISKVISNNGLVF